MAQDLNHVTIIGRLTRDGDLRYSSGGMAILRFTLAVTRSKKEGNEWVQEANFFDIVLFGKSAENLKLYLSKAKQVAISGELRQERWEQEGVVKNRVIVVAHSVQLLGGSAEKENRQASSQEFHELHQDNQLQDYSDDIPF